MFRIISSAILIATAGIVLACGAHQSGQEDARGTLRFQCNVTDAVLEVDEQRVGPIGLFKEQGLMLRPGSHRIIVRRQGYFDFYLMVEVQRNDLKVIDVPLSPIPD